MSQTMEAEISPDGRESLLEPVHLPGMLWGSGAALLALQDSPEFANATPGDPEQMERGIAANRDEWGD